MISMLVMVSDQGVISPYTVWLDVLHLSSFLKHIHFLLLLTFPAFYQVHLMIHNSLHHS